MLTSEARRTVTFSLAFGISRGILSKNERKYLVGNTRKGNLLGKRNGLGVICSMAYRKKFSNVLLISRCCMISRNMYVPRPRKAGRYERIRDVRLNEKGPGKINCTVLHTKQIKWERNKK